MPEHDFRQNDMRTDDLTGMTFAKIEVARRMVAVAAFAFATVTAVAGDASCANAFTNAEFESSASCGEGSEYVEFLPRCGINGSGGLRVHATDRKHDGVSYRFPSGFKPKAGRKYVFSVCRKVHGKVRAELAWQCWKGGWCRAHNWNTTLVPLDGGWERQENTLFLRDKDLENGELRFFVKVMPAQGAKPGDVAWVDYDSVAIREDAPEWYFSNVWPTHDKIFRETGRIRFHSGFLGPFVPDGHRAKYRLTLASSSGRMLAWRDMTPADGTFTAEFGRLNYNGSASLKVEISDATTGTKLGEKILKLTVAPQYRPKKGEVVITEDGQTLIDGKPFMPLGFYTSLGSSGGDLDHARRELKKISDGRRLQHDHGILDKQLPAQGQDKGVLCDMRVERHKGAVQFLGCVQESRRHGHARLGR